MYDLQDWSNLASMTDFLESMRLLLRSFLDIAGYNCWKFWTFRLLHILKCSLFGRLYPWITKHKFSNSLDLIIWRRFLNVFTTYLPSPLYMFRISFCNLWKLDYGKLIMNSFLYRIINVNPKMLVVWSSWCFHCSCRNVNGFLELWSRLVTINVGRTRH